MFFPQTIRFIDFFGYLELNKIQSYTHSGSKTCRHYLTFDSWAIREFIGFKIDFIDKKKQKTNSNLVYVFCRINVVFLNQFSFYRDSISELEILRVTWQNLQIEKRNFVAISASEQQVIEAITIKHLFGQDCYIYKLGKKCKNSNVVSFSILRSLAFANVQLPL